MLRGYLSAFRLLERRTVWWPTFIGWCVIAGGFVFATVWWFLAGESFLSPTERAPMADVLVVEGWIGPEGVRAAASEFKGHGYQYLATSGGPISGSWDNEDANYAEMAGLELMRLGVPSDRIVVAPCKDTESRRTFESAAAVLDALKSKGLRAKALDVFTCGAHARRSRLVFAKVLSPEITIVGVIAWRPVKYGSESWWRSSERSKELLSESAGYIFELLLNSGRLTNRSAIN
jgi:DUF218 domain-containing protein